MSACKKVAFAASIGFLILSLAFVSLTQNLHAGVVAQHATGYPTSGQWKMFVLVPTCLFALNAALLLFTRWVPCSVQFTLFPIQIVCMLSLIFFGTGGV